MSMKILHTVVSTEGFRTPSCNAQRLRLLRKLLQLTSENKAQLLVIPGGFFSVRDWHEIDQIIQEAGRLAEEIRVTLIGGADLIRPENKLSREIDELVAPHKLPFFGFAVNTASAHPKSRSIWRQTSTNNQNADRVADEHLPGSTRIMDVTGKSVAILICGELFNKRARDSIAALHPDMVIDIGHSGMGQGLIPAMRSVAHYSRCPVVHSQHLKGYKNRNIHFVDSNEYQHSQEVTANPLIWDQDVWAGWALRSI